MHWLEIGWFGWWWLFVNGGREGEREGQTFHSRFGRERKEGGRLLLIDKL